MTVLVYKAVVMDVSKWLAVSVFLVIKQFSSITTKEEAASSSETSVKIYG